MNAPSRTRPVVAIDGPAGAGKSTVTRRVAERLGYTRVDTGALYRAVAWLTIERGVHLDDVAGVARIARELAEPGAIALGPSSEGTKITVLGRDVSTDIRAQQVGLAASQTSQLPEVRAALLDMQRELGRDGGVVLEGRDIGSVVFPDAEAKFFLTASSRVRAERRRAELLERGDAPSLEQVQSEVEERDRRDSLRSVAPLVRADDAVLVDSSELGIDQVVETMVARVQAVAAELAQRNARA
ncbi:MAG TPA: (d)CMP kinase [Polyangiaceae bacterium]|nr:(d)CMP kinase [Polyangiaceae bacterium]